MAITTFEPGPTGAPIVKGRRVVGHVSFGGSMLLMPVVAKTVLFEMHHWFGPIPTSKRTGEALERIPKGFWEAWERWNLGGKLVDGDLCIVPAWCSSCGGSGRELEHLGGKHYQDLGECKVCGGSRLAPPVA